MKTRLAFGIRTMDALGNNNKKNPTCILKEYVLSWYD